MKLTDEIDTLWASAYAVAFAVLLHAMAITKEDAIEPEDIEDVDTASKVAAERVIKTIQEKGAEIEARKKSRG